MNSSSLLISTIEKLAYDLWPHGYYEHTSCHVMIASTDDVLTKSKQRASFAQAEIASILAPNADEDWIDDFLLIEEHDRTKLNFYTSMFQRIKGQQCFIKLQKNLKTIGIGTAIIKDDWTGILNISIDASLRRRGFSYLLLHSLAQWSAERNSPHMFLQVVADNKPAVTLYENIGFRPLYQYHYWSKA